MNQSANPSARHPGHYRGEGKNSGLATGTYANRPSTDQHKDSLLAQSSWQRTLVGARGKKLSAEIGRGKIGRSARS